MADLSVWIQGKARPKGSLDLMDGGRVKENNPASTPWRKHVVNVLRKHLAAAGSFGLTLGTLESWPIDVPVGVRLRFLFVRPANAKFDLPGTRATGDVDKLTRNVLDALTDAGVIVDDALVCDLDVNARYTPGAAGVLIEVWRVRDGREG